MDVDVDRGTILLNEKTKIINLSGKPKENRLRLLIDQVLTLSLPEGSIPQSASSPSRIFIPK